MMEKKTHRNREFNPLSLKGLPSIWVYRTQQSLQSRKKESSIERLSECGVDSVEESHGFRDAVEGQNACTVIQVVDQWSPAPASPEALWLVSPQFPAGIWPAASHQSIFCPWAGSARWRSSRCAPLFYRQSHWWPPPPVEAPSHISPSHGFSDGCCVDSHPAVPASLSSLLQLTLCCGLYVPPQSRDNRYTADQYGRTSSLPHHDESRCSPGASRRAPPACVSVMELRHNEAGGVSHSSSRDQTDQTGL